jgi:hypothetical protein
VVEDNKGLKMSDKLTPEETIADLEKITKMQAELIILLKKEIVQCDEIIDRYKKYIEFLKGIIKGKDLIIKNALAVLEKWKYK